MSNPTPEVSEEQRARALGIVSEWAWLPIGPLTQLDLANSLAQALAQESSREHERAEGLERKLAALRSCGEDGGCGECIACSDELIGQRGDEIKKANARAEGLVKELEAIRAECERQHDLYVDAAETAMKATARVAELEKQLTDTEEDRVDAVADSINEEKRADKAEAELARLRATQGALAAAPLGAPIARPEVLAERERCARLASSATMDPESRMIHPDIPFGEFGEAAKVSAHATAQAIAAAIRDGTK